MRSKCGPQTQSAWYGVSPDTLQRGLDELREAELLYIHPRKVRDSKARFGTTIVNEYLLLGSFVSPNVARAPIKAETT